MEPLSFLARKPDVEEEYALLIRAIVCRSPGNAVIFLGSRSLRSRGEMGLNCLNGWLNYGILFQRLVGLSEKLG